jgi:hypothetical protein
MADSLVGLLLNGGWSNLANIVTAVGGLGTAAMGLVDTTKILNGGPSNFGFGSVKEGLKAYLDALDPSGATSPVKDKVLQTLRANWLNGVAKADQKAIAKSLIHVGLTPTSADGLAKAANVDATTLKNFATDTAAGKAATSDQVNVVGQFDIALSAALDAAYERGDQTYRNGTKFCAMIVSIILGGIGGEIVFSNDPTSIILCLLMGVIATPLAPVAKDVASAIQTAVGTASALKH